MSVRLEGVGRTVGAATHLYPTDVAFAPGLNVLLGPTNAGKTTLLRLLAGLDRPSAGRVLEDGADVTGRDVRRRSVAMVYQQFINYPSLTVFDNIASPLRLGGRSREEIDRRVREVADLLHIDHLLGRVPAELSGGQQQRTAIGRALAKDAKLLLLDEPLVNLDYKLREELRVELASLFARRDAVVVYATTEPQEALLLGGQVVVVEAGRVLQAGPVLDVYHRPASTAVARVFSDPPMNVVAGRLERGEVRLAGGVAFAPSAHLDRLGAGSYRFGVRAHQLGLARRHPDEVPLPAVVGLAEVSGSETIVHATCGEMDLVVQAEGIHPIELGAAIDVYLDPSRLFVFDSERGALVAAPARPGAV